MSNENSMMSQCVERVKNGIFTENPTFVQMLGMCPTLAVTTSAINGMGMGLTTTVILIMSNFMIALLRKFIPDRVRIPAYIVIVASFVTIVQFLLEGFIPSLYDSLGIYIPLIVVNCIILGRAEAYASKNKVLPSIFDGLGMGLGFTVGLTFLGAFRELIGAGTIFSLQIMPKAYEPVTIFILAPGAFFVLAILIAIINFVNSFKKNTDEVVEEDCNKTDCEGCKNTLCGKNIFTVGESDDAKSRETNSVKDKKVTKTGESNHKKMEEENTSKQDNGTTKGEAKKKQESSKQEQRGSEVKSQSSKKQDAKTSKEDIENKKEEI